MPGEPRQGRKHRKPAISRSYSVAPDRLDFSRPNGTLLRLMRDHDGTWRVLIEVGEEATQEALRQTASLACRFRDRLVALQGPEDHRLHFLLMLDHVRV